MNNVQTKRICPYAVGRIGGEYTVPSYIENPEAILSQNDDAYCRWLFEPGASEHKYLSLLFRVDIPQFAALQGGRFISRAVFDNATLAPVDLRLYEVHFLEGGQRTGYRIDTVNFHGAEISTVETVLSSLAQTRLIERLNNDRELRFKFELRFRAHLPSGSDLAETNVLSVSTLAIEIDYTLPEFPIDAELTI